MSAAGPLFLPYGGVNQSRAKTGFGTNYSFTLGSLVDRIDDLKANGIATQAELKQDIDLTGVDVITFQLGLNGPSNPYDLSVCLLNHFNDISGQTFDPDFVRDGGMPTITTYGSPAIVAPGVGGYGDGALQLDAAEGVMIEGTNMLETIVHRMAIRFRVKPTYTGTPSANQYFFSLVEDFPASAKNAVQLRHLTGTGVLSIAVNTSEGAVILATSFGVWAPVSGTWYNFELNIDVDPDGFNPATRLFIDGVQFGSTLLSTGERSAELKQILHGVDPGLDTSVQAFVLDEFQVYDRVLHIANFTESSSELIDPLWYLRIFANTTALAVIPIFQDLDETFVQRVVNVSTLTGTQTLRFVLQAL